MDMKRILLSLIIVGVTPGFSSAQYISGVLDWINFPHDFKFEENYRPYTSAMGKLEFSVADTTGDMFTNPAKFYSGSRVFFTPSIYFYNLKPNLETQDGKEYEGSRERIADIPVGFVLSNNNFFWGASASFSDYKLRYYRWGEEETYSGPSLFGLVGYRLSESSQFGISYKYTNYTTKRENTNPYKTYSDLNQIKAGLRIEQQNQKWNFLGSYYFSKYQVGEESDNNIRESDGILAQVENQRKLSDVTYATLRLTYDYANLASSSVEDDTKNAGGIGVGLSSFLSDILIAAELEFEYIKVKSDNSTTSEFKQRNFNFRSGIDVPISESLSWTGGINFSRLSVDAEYYSNTVPEFFLIHEPTFEQTSNALTTGLAFRSTNFLIRYQFSYGNEPYLIYNWSAEYSLNLFFNRVMVEYRF